MLVGCLCVCLCLFTSTTVASLVLNGCVADENVKGEKFKNRNKKKKKKKRNDGSVDYKIQRHKIWLNRCRVDWISKTMGLIWIKIWSAALNRPCLRWYGIGDDLPPVNCFLFYSVDQRWQRRCRLNVAHVSTVSRRLFPRRLIAVWSITFCIHSSRLLLFFFSELYLFWFRRHNWCLEPSV